MNGVVAARFVERVDRLAIGFEPVDPLSGGRLAHAVRMEIEGIGPRPAVDRHDSCLHVLLYTPALAAEVVVRIWEAERIYVPRRLRIPLLTAAAAEQKQQDEKTWQHRVRRPALFPGAAYEPGAGATGLRARVVRGDGTPVRWARLEARRNGTLLGRAAADDRGEALLLLAAPPHPAPPELADPWEVEVTAFGPATAPVPSPVDLPSRDPLWDVPIEQLAAPGDPDPAAAGEVLPYAPNPASTRIIPFRLGRVLSGVDDFELV